MCRATRISVAHTPAHEIFMMQKIGLSDPASLLEKFDDEARAAAQKAISYRGPNKSKWLKLPMSILAQLIWKVCSD